VDQLEHATSGSKWHKGKVEPIQVVEPRSRAQCRHVDGGRGGSGRSLTRSRPLEVAHGNSKPLIQHSVTPRLELFRDQIIACN
jgi:hypothetical protein